MNTDVNKNPLSIPMSSADLNEADIQAVVAVVRSGRLALGPQAVEFERLVAEYVGVKHALTVSSGTSALHLLVRACGLGPGDEVLVPSFTFASSVNAILFEGATPVFVDVEPDTYNLDPDDVAQKVTSRTKAMMAVDIFGHPAEWDALTRVAQQHGLRVIDDSCEALGAVYKGRKIGTFGDAAAFAFYPNKQMTVGEGGMIVTDDDEIARVCRSMRNQGRPEMGAWLEHERLGYNYRLDEMSAALGVSQFKRLESFLAKREKVARMYTARLQALDWVRPPVVKPHVRMSWFVYVITLAEGLARDTIIQKLEAQGIPARGYFAPIHTQPYIRERFGDLKGTLPITEAIATRTLALPFHNSLSEEEVGVVVGALKRSV
ncbi:MAG TPA: DegT/DnrJ/EryC1/StrS family aminotransferase [Anaerolineae bacterium]|nr:DegT/DnrJ/EryC1/StrS family aminotransferase [Anaerolineae bacterium]